MKSKLLDSALRLLEKRKTDLSLHHASGMNAFGKHNSNEVFVWVQPEKAILESTLRSFPSPVLWISLIETQEVKSTDSAEITAVILEETGEELLKKISDLIQHHTNTTILVTADRGSIKEIAAIEELLLIRAYR